MLRDEEISVILVDENDNLLGFGDKLEVHKKGLLHRAFSIFLFNEEGDLLLQQRAFSKYHAKGLWANTCCGHPLPGEDTKEAAERRLQEEMGFTVPLTSLTHIYYKKGLENGMIEHEYVHVFKGAYKDHQPIKPDPSEVAGYRFEKPNILRHHIQGNPEQYAAWFVHYIDNHFNQLFVSSP